MPNNPLYLIVPYNEKEAAKALGARWDANVKKWFAPSSLPAENFARWLDGVPQVTTNATPSISGSKQAIPQVEPTIKVTETPVDTTGLPLRQLLQRVSSTVNAAFGSPLWVIAEISSLKVTGSGHCALELVEHDDKGQLVARVRAFIWKAQYSTLQNRFQDATGDALKEGIKVMLQAKVEYSPAYDLRLTVSDIDPSYTLGDIAANLKRIRDTLEKEGVINRNRILPAPLDFVKVAVISPTAAAGLGDFQADALRLSEAGLCEMHYFSALFQGKGAAESIANCLSSIIASGQAFDALCIIRGGGAVTDLYWLNDLSLARAVCLCPIPVYTGIGHERDNTILDEIAHKRFDTPSKTIGFIRETVINNAMAAAENYKQIVVKLTHTVALTEQANEQLLQQIRQASQQRILFYQSQIESAASHLMPGITRVFAQAEHAIEQLQANILSRTEKTLSEMHLRIDQRIQDVLNNAGHSIQKWETSLLQNHQFICRAISTNIEQSRHAMNALTNEIVTVGPAKTLSRGFAIVRAEDGHLITSAEKAKECDALDVQFKDGVARVVVKAEA